MTRFEAVEITAHQAWFLAEHLHAGSFPGSWLSPPLFRPLRARRLQHQDPGRARCIGVLDAEGNTKPSVAQSIRTICHASQWLEWLTLDSTDNERVLRGVLARSSDSDAIVALRYAQMVTFTPLQLTHSEAVVPIITAGCPAMRGPPGSPSSSCLWTSASRSTPASHAALTSSTP